MRVTSLKLANLRAIETAEFRFQSEFNLIVGVNGVGKTSMLDALRVCLSAFVKQANQLRAPVEAFALDDIRVGANALGVDCYVQIGSTEHHYLIHKPREASAPQEKKAGMPREQVHDTPGKALFLGHGPTPVTGWEPGGRPLAVLFSTNRAVPSERAPSKSVAAGGTAAAFADAFANRELQLGELAAWMRVQDTLRSERPLAGRALAGFEEALSRFLPGYTNLRVDSTKRPRLLIDHGRSTVSVRQMSDGERGTLALVLDLIRRLVQANPEMSDPVTEAEAVVLIDEIDLHLHPKWQRQIVHKLTMTFPRCQFIATTHSPQVLASVDPDQVHLLASVGIARPDRSLGMDSNWILRHVMEADDRPENATAAIQSVERLIGKGTFEEARTAISEAKKNGFDLPEWSVLEARIARLEILAK